MHHLAPKQIIKYDPEAQTCIGAFRCSRFKIYDGFNLVLDYVTGLPENSYLIVPMGYDCHGGVMFLDVWVRGDFIDWVAFIQSEGTVYKPLRSNPGGNLRNEILKNANPSRST
jgi:hypothetical protein